MGNDKGWWSWSWAEALRRKDFAAIADWFSVRFFFIGGIGIIVVAIAAASEQTVGAGLRIATLSLLFGAACTVSGWLLGLLFGVPRTLSRPTANGPAPATSAADPATGAPTGANPSSRVNTNLEDISDWLTKTLVGVGLTQLLAAPHYIWGAAGKLNALGFGWVPYGQLLAVALFFYFTAGGFWLGYIGTRTILTKLFDFIDGPPADSVAVAGKSENLKLDLSTLGIASGSASVAQADRSLLATPLQTLTTPQEFAAWGAAQARTGNLTAAQTALEEANRVAPQDSAIRQQLATVYTALGRRADAERLLTNGATSEVAVLNALYEPRPQGFTKAIDIGRQLAAKPGAERNVNLHVWLACAYGQKYSFVKQEKPDDPSLPDIRKAAIDEMKAAINADPTSRALLRSLWKPSAGAEDTDLDGFDPNDADLKALLEPAG